MTINATTSQPVTPVEELREAAWLMRERAKKATPGPWLTDQSEIYSQVQGGPWVGETLKIDDDAQTRADSEHIAGWHPAVALVVAAWLDCVAIDDECEPENAPRIRERTTALAVARAYLGGTR